MIMNFSWKIALKILGIHAELPVLYSGGGVLITVKIQNIWTPEKFAVIALKFEQDGFTIK